MNRPSRAVKHGATIYLEPGRRQGVEVFAGGAAIFLKGKHVVGDIVIHEGASLHSADAELYCDRIILHPGASVQGDLL